MKIIEPAATIIDEINADQIMKKLETCGRVCYKSENKILDGSAETFIRGIIKRGHESVLEHVSISVRFVCDRGVSHEIVRHRLASYSQESTRYCNYMKDDFGSEITVIEPNYLNKETVEYLYWERACQHAESEYFNMLDAGLTAQAARAVLPNSLKTELIMTANLREWRHFFKLRTAPAAHPQMRQVVIPLLAEFKKLLPVIFEDLGGC